MYVPCILYSLLPRPTNAQHIYVSFRFLWPCIVSKLWSERENQRDATVRCLFLTISQHVSGIIMPIFRRTTCSNTRLVLLKMGIMMPETCWEIVKNKHLTVASRWFSLSLHIYVNNIVYIVSAATCFNASASPSESLNLVLAKVTITTQ